MHEDGGVKRLGAHTPACVGQTSPSGKKCRALKQLKERIQMIHSTFEFGLNFSNLVKNDSIQRSNGAGTPSHAHSVTDYKRR